MIYSLAKLSEYSTTRDPSVEEDLPVFTVPNLPQTVRSSYGSNFSFALVYFVEKRNLNNCRICQFAFHKQPKALSLPELKVSSCFPRIEETHAK